MSHYSRTAWGARKPEDKYPLELSRVKGVALHWPAMRSRVRGPANVFRLLRNIQVYHMDSKGWSDIAYQIAVDQDGNTYTLRGKRYRSGANGDTVPNLEYGAVLLVLAIGEQPTKEMIASVNKELVSYRKFMTHATQVVGHQQVRPEPTECPGAIVMGLIHNRTIH